MDFKDFFGIALVLAIVLAIWCRRHIGVEIKIVHEYRHQQVPAGQEKTLDDADVEQARKFLVARRQVKNWFERRARGAKKNENVQSASRPTAD